MRMIKLVTVVNASEMFDGYVDTVDSAAVSLSESFPVDGCNAVAVFNTHGVSATLTVVDDVTSATVYSATISLISDQIDDWWDYWFAPIRNGRDMVFYFPTQTNATATITISNPLGTATCGMVAPGVATEISGIKYGAKIGITDYSFIDTNDFGVSYLSIGSWAKRAAGNFNLPNTLVDSIGKKMVSIRATPAVFDLNKYEYELETSHSSENGFKSLIVYGFVEDYNTEIIAPRHSSGSIEIQGMI